MGFASQVIGGTVAFAKVGPAGFDSTFGDGGVVTGTQFVSAPTGLVQLDGKILVAVDSSFQTPDLPHAGESGGHVLRDPQSGD